MRDETGDEAAGTPATGVAAARLAELGERYFTTQHRHDPFNATLLGLSEFDDLVGDPSREGDALASEGFRAVREGLAALDPAGLDERDRLEHTILSVLNRGAEGEVRHALWAANASAKSYVSRQGLVFQAIPSMTVADDAGAQRYLTRLAGVPGLLRGLGERYLAEAADGRRSTAVGVGHAVEQLAGYLAVDLDEDVLLRPVSGFADDRRDRARRLVEREVRPAMADLAGTLATRLLPGARPDDQVGVCHLPDGDAGYDAALARYTTTTLDAAEIHQVGLDTLAELAPRWREVGQRALGLTDFTELTDRLRADPSLRFRSGAEIIAVAESALRRAQDVQDDYFPRYPIPGCVIEEINPVDAAHSAAAYYRPPAVDGSRPGAHCLLTTESGTRFAFEAECIAFHESVPGHHLQLATAQLLDIPRYRRYLDVEACSFNEGWGLYCEQLADEIGLYSSDLDRLGMLSYTALRACRLVVDTGLHRFGWSRQRAIDFMWANTATTEANVRNEVDRYIAWPGQAVSYLVGQREILRLRAQARAALGDRFSIRGFHDAVLTNGAVPLPVLAEQVGRWQAATAGAR